VRQGGARHAARLHDASECHFLRLQLRKFLVVHPPLLLQHVKRVRLAQRLEVGLHQIEIPLLLRSVIHLVLRQQRVLEDGIVGTRMAHGCRTANHEGVHRSASSTSSSTGDAGATLACAPLGATVSFAGRTPLLGGHRELVNVRRET